MSKVVGLVPDTGQRTGKRLVYGMENELMHSAAIAETDFGLGRMNVNVDQGRIDGKEQAVGRMTAAVQHVLIGFAQGMADELVTDETPVDITILRVVARPRVGWGGTIAKHMQWPGAGIDEA